MKPQVQVFNRDISVLMLGLFAQWRYVEKAEVKARKEANRAGGDGKAAAAAERKRLYALSAAELDELVKADAATGGIRVLDALAATALRSVRYAKEVPGCKEVVANDLEPDAAAMAAKVIADNGAGDTCTARCGDAIALMAEHRDKNRFDVVDLDPPGPRGNRRSSDDDAAASGRSKGDAPPRRAPGTSPVGMETLPRHTEKSKSGTAPRRPSSTRRSRPWRTGASCASRRRIWPCSRATTPRSASPSGARRGGARS